MVGVAALAVVIVIVGVLMVTRNGDDTTSPKAGSGFVEPTNSPAPSPSPARGQGAGLPGRGGPLLRAHEHHRPRRGPQASR